MAQQLRAISVNWHNSEKAGQSPFQYVRKNCQLICCASGTTNADRAPPLPTNLLALQMYHTI